LVVLVGDGVGVGVLVGDLLGDGVLVGDLLGEGDVLVGDGLGLVEAGTVGEVVGLVDLLLLELLLGLGVALPDLLVLSLGRMLADVLLLCVGSALDEAVVIGLVVVGSVVVRLTDGSTVAEAELRGLVVPDGELLAGELVVGVTLADGELVVEEALELGVVLWLVLVLAESLVLPLIGRSGLPAAWLTLRCRPLYSARCLPAWCLETWRTSESSRIAALGRVAQDPLTIGGPPSTTRYVVIPKASVLDARSTNPVKAPSATGRTSRTLAVLTFTTPTL
jgi:hypothetical protein